MVATEATKSQTVKNNPPFFYHFKLIISFLMLGISVTLFTFILCFLINNQFFTENPIIISANRAETNLVEEPIKEYPKIDFQPVVDAWLKGLGGNKSVLIYDLDRDEIVGEYNASEKYGTASLYKLFVVYEGYRRLESGKWNANDKVPSTDYTVLKCLDLAIRESYSPCAEVLWDRIGRSELDRIIETDFGIKNSSISHLISNPKDVSAMMKIFYEHKDISDEKLLAKMKDSFLSQPVTTYNWRQGLPSGFSKANVYNKVGWDYNAKTRNWNIYHDAAIIEFEEQNRHFIVVVMTNRVPYQKIRQLGTEIENKFLNSIKGN